MLFEKVVGHKKQKGLFATAMKNGTIGNAYMFSGIEGIGKRLFAKEFVKSLNCKDNGEKTPCGMCPNCKRIDDGNFPDFIMVEPDGKQIKTEQIRNLIKETSYFPVEAERRVVVLNDAQAMNITAANTFLKTLEDSSEHTTFILIVSETRNLPQTILSRCQIIKFAPLKTDEIISILEEKKEDYDKHILENLSAGSVLKACEFSGKFSAEKLTKVYDEFSGIKADQFNRVFEFSESLIGNYPDINDLIIVFKILFMDVLRHNMSMGLKFLSEVQESSNSTNYVNIVKKLASNNSLNIIFKKLELLSKIEMEQRFNLNKKLSVERMMLSLL